MRSYAWACLLLVCTVCAWPAFPQAAFGTGFSVSVSLWPTPDLPVGNPSQIILSGQIRNESSQGVVWRPFAPQSMGYGQVRAVGTGAPLCETPRQNVRSGAWENPFAMGTSTPYRYEFAGIACPALPNPTPAVEARFCVNPHMFSPLPEGTCSQWVRVQVDPAAAALRRDDDVLRGELRTFQQTAAAALQNRLLGALELRAMTEQPTPEEQSSAPLGRPDHALATLWLAFFKAEDAAMDASRPASMPTTNVIPRNGCWGTQADPHPCARTDPEKEAQYQRAIRENSELIAKWNSFRALENTSTSSVADFGMWMGPQYRRNRLEREKLYAQAAAMGLPEKQISELRRFLEFANSND